MTVTVIKVNARVPAEHSHLLVNTKFVFIRLYYLYYSLSFLM